MIHFLCFIPFHSGHLKECLRSIEEEIWNFIRILCVSVHLQRKGKETQCKSPPTF